MASSLPPRAQAVLDFWMGEGWETAPPDDGRTQMSGMWWGGSPELDADIRARFTGDAEALLAGEYDGWQAAPLSALAGVVLGDQLFRNLYRGTAGMYAADAKALAWSTALLDGGGAAQLKPIQRMWVLMPFMHSEELADQERCVAEFRKLSEECAAAGLPAMAAAFQNNVKFGLAHLEVVKRWGRFPHRNAILGRPSTPEEAEGIAAGTIPKW